MIIYTVKQGDTVSSIARKYSVSAETVILTNNLSNPNLLLIGQSLIIATENRSYFVTAGDSVYSIALSFSVSAEEIIKLNNLREPYIIYPGEELLIPPGNLKRKIQTNGYCYPTISENTVVSLSPYLTYLTVFSYKILPDGTLESIDDERVINLAKQNGIAPIMAVTNIGERGFSSENLSAVINSNASAQTLINNIVSTALNKGYRGINIDFEYVFPADRENFNSFLGMLYIKANSEGLLLSSALAPKIKADQSGLLYESHDYRSHAENTDYSIIMTYEWGYLYGPPMAVSPINEVEKVLSYAVTESNSGSLMMSLPNYAYDWLLPYRSGRPAKILNLNDAFNLALQKRVEIQYNELNATPFFEYSENGENHIVWFDDAKSLYAKAELISKFNLLGVSFWTVNNFYEQAWIVLSSLYEIDKI